MIVSLNYPKQGLHFEWNRFLRKKCIFLFSGFMVPKKLVPVSFCVFLTKWLEIFLLVLEQSLWRSYATYPVYLVDLLACLTKDQQFSFDVCGKLPPSYDFKAWTLESFQYRMLDETKFFSHWFILHRNA